MDAFYALCIVCASVCVCVFKIRDTSSYVWIFWQMILYDTPGVIEKKMHKLDSMMMKNVRSAAINADCVLVVVDACKAPQDVWILSYGHLFSYFGCVSRYLS